MEIKTKFNIGDKAYIRETFGIVSEVTIEEFQIYARRDALGNLHVYESYKTKRKGLEERESGRMIEAESVFPNKAEAAKDIIDEKRKLIKRIEDEIAELERGENNESGN